MPDRDSEFFVTCSKCGLRRADQINFNNIDQASEEPDMLTFECKACNKVCTSLLAVDCGHTEGG